LSKLVEKDSRFTRYKANKVVYALVLGGPMDTVVVRSLRLSAPTSPGKVAGVELLGTGDKIGWTQDGDALRVDLPKQYRPPVDYAASVKVTLV